MRYHISSGSRAALRCTLGRNFSLLAHLPPTRRWPVPQTSRPTGWALYPKPSYGRPMVYGHLLSIRSCPRDKERSVIGQLRTQKHCVGPSIARAYPQGRTHPDNPELSLCQRVPSVVVSKKAVFRIC